MIYLTIILCALFLSPALVEVTGAVIAYKERKRTEEELGHTFLSIPDSEDYCGLEIIAKPKGYTIAVLRKGCCLLRIKDVYGSNLVDYIHTIEGDYNLPPRTYEIVEYKIYETTTQPIPPHR